MGSLATGSVTASNGQSAESDVVHHHVRLRQDKIVAVARVAVRLSARYMQRSGTTRCSKTVGGSSCRGELGTGGCPAEVISDGRADANREILL
jgi:hypothetical protein